MNPARSGTKLRLSTFTLAALLATSPMLTASPTLPVSTGAQLLAAELNGAAADLDHATCDVPATSLHRALLKHRSEAVPIFVAALTHGREAVRGNAKEPCACVTRLLRIALATAPEQASPMVEQERCCSTRVVKRNWRM